MVGKTGEPRVPATLQKSRLKTEEKILDLDFQLESVQFNELGRYTLRLTAENPLVEGSEAGVQLRVNEGEVLHTNTATTNVVEQANLSEVYMFEKRRFLFILPKGFCKNDKNHDARLRIEALRQRGTFLKTTVKTGEAFFAIYPRTNQPRINLFASKDEDLYRYSDIMVLLRAGGNDLAMHCGRLAYTVSFHEHRPNAKREIPITPRHLSPLVPRKEEKLQVEVGGSYLAPLQLLEVQPERTPGSALERRPSQVSLTAESHVRGHSPYGPPESQKEVPDEDIQGFLEERSILVASSSSSSSSSSLAPALPRTLPSHASLHLPSPGDSPKLASFFGLLVKEDPAGPGQAALTSHTNDWHLANPEKESITFVLHSASNLPSTRKGNVPHPYVIVKTTSEEDSKQPAQAVTHVSAQPTYAPTWEERVTVEIDSIKAGEEDVSLTVADKDSKEILAKYNIPVKYLRPFHHYHCALVLPRKKDQTGTKLYASIIRKRSLIPRYAGVNYTGLEVFLKGINEPLAQPGGKVKAVARIVNNLGAYIQEMKARLPDAPAVPLTVVNFPDPVMEDFDVPRVNNHGYPQVSSLGGPPEQPMWNTSFLFQGRDGATAFSDDTALLIEYYKSTPGDDLEGTPMFLGYSVLPLTNRVYRKLAADSSRSGIRVENLPIQDTTMKTTSGGLPTVQLGLQLINSERPDIFLTSSTTTGLPVLDPELVGELGTIKEPWTRPTSKTEQKTATPSARDSDSYIEPDRVSSYFDLTDIQSNRFPLPDAVAKILPGKDSRPVIEEIQDMEIDNYRAALKKMADDILSLRQHISTLERENSALRRNLALHEDIGRALLQDIDLDVMTKAEIVDRILVLKKKLTSGAREMARMKDRIQRLQNELIRKNDREKDLVMLQRAHQQQQMVLRKYQAKISKMQNLEDAVRQQEKVIERMERMLEGKMKERIKEASFGELSKTAGDNWSKDVYSTLLMENMRLRDELGKSSFRSPIILQQQALPDTFSNSTEKLSLVSKLEKAEARILALEHQLEDSAKTWGREKQDYNTRLLENDLGFNRSPSSFILHDIYPNEKERRDNEEKYKNSGKVIQK
ncbi:coiled-coil domain-containing protein 33 isoform X2 [Ahaetulla prasina]|uniref:coiled-coil domain-containing protein 33 isoform X2 n=1 Tax=Ahaetulla prasina TaxID=499056 RepID=UPI0026489C1C|nr:coiled-coil domain-containing protein 33 isoform X2 [Ahaetulla prasina]